MNFRKDSPDALGDQTMSSTSQSSETSSTGSTSSETGFVSVHRRSLLHISNDGKQNKLHRVPEHSSPRARVTDKFRRGFQTFQDGIHRKTPSQWTETFLPCYKWLPTYQWKSTLPKDVVAGLTVGVMIVPQSMSYAKLAGLPVEFGLYSSLVPVFAYAVFGSSRQLAVGPVALISLLLSTGLTSVLSSAGISQEDPTYQNRYNVLSIQTAFLVGLSYIVMGILRMGFVTIFLSHAVVSGFTSGAAVIIGMSQLKYVFGYDIANSKVLHEIIRNLIDGLSDFNYKTFVMGFGSILTLLGMKRFGRKYPRFKWMRAMGPLTVVVVTIALTWGLDLGTKGIPIVGTIPKGLPPFTADLWTPIPELNHLALVVVSITIVGFMESIAIAKQLASKHKYQLDSSQELFGLGMANFLGAMFHSYPVTGSFSRSAVNNESGAQSGISGMVTAALVGLVLLLLTPVFEQLPLCVLAAIVISGVIGLIDHEEAIYLWKVHKFDLLVWLVAFLGTMFLGVEIGLAIAVGVSLLLVVYESAIPHTAVLGRLPGSTVYRNVKQYPEAERYDGIVAVRIDAPLYFANTQSVREKLEKYELAAERLLEERKATVDQVKYLVLDLSPVSHVDTSGLHMLHDMLHMYKDRGIVLCFSNPSVQVMKRFQSSRLVEQVGEEHIFVRIHDAVNWCLHQLDTHAVSLHGADCDQDDKIIENSEDEIDLECQETDNQERQEPQPCT